MNFVIKLHDSKKTGFPPDIPCQLSLERFFVAIVVKPGGDPAYERLKALYFSKYADVTEAQIRRQAGIIEQRTKAQRTIIEAEALSAKRKHAAVSR